MNKISKFTIGGIFAVALFIRCISIDFSKLDDYIVTNYDGLGYYMYLPAIFIYQDITQFEWLEAIDSKYKVAGEDWMFQISKHENGNYVTKYLGGIAFLQLPFFLVAHGYALLSDYPADGFSTPYQLTLSFGPLVYFILILFLLRKILLRYYDDEEVAWTLGLLFIASNALEYISIESGHSHGYILLMYTLVIWWSVKWHEHPTKLIAFAIGLVIGGATIMRPTELIIFLIPLLWNTHTKASAKVKWDLVNQHKKHVGLLLLGAFLGALPQIMYWLYVTGSPIHTIGSKWYFLNPYFRVLFGWQKGWFIYTPITIFFVLGLFFMKRKPFSKSVIWFCVLNIWIVISWSVWRYGGSYSTRALVQSYPVFALALAGWISWVIQQKWRHLFYVLVIYLSVVNLFQIWQYRQGILRHDEMNRAYYQAVYLDKNPTPLDMSMLDGGEKIKFLCAQSVYLKNVVPKDEIQAGSVFFKTDLQEGEWIDAQIELRTTHGFWKGFIVVQFFDEAGKEMEKRAFRMFNHLTRSTQVNPYHIQFKMPKGAGRVEFKFGGGADVAAEVRSLVVKKCI